MRVPLRLRQAGSPGAVAEDAEELTAVHPPDYAHLKGKKTRDGRDFDTGTRGLGGREMCSIGEENLLCLSNQRYRQADIFVHEFSHSMMANMDAEEIREIEAAYKNAVHKKLYPRGFI